MLNSQKIHKVKGRFTVYFDKRRFLLSSDHQIGDIVEAQDLPARDPSKKDTVRRLLFGADLIGEPTANQLTRWLISLIPARNYIWVFLGLVVLNFVCFPLINVSVAPPSNTILYGVKVYLMLAAVLFWHELGHCAAARRLGIRVDSIGCGLYLVFPAFYSRISLANLLSWRERVVLYSSGIFFQLLLSFGIISIYMMTHAPIFRHLYFLNIFTMMFNIVPIFHLDGYRILTEILGQYSGRSRKYILGTCLVITLVTVICFVGRLGWSLYKFVPTILTTPTITNIGLGIILTGFLVLIAFVVPKWLRKPEVVLIDWTVWQLS